MQEFQPVAGVAGRLLFGGGAAGGNNIRHGGEAAATAPEEVRCPRCDSANTKFCYYNNYNLAQPRHFCKACRRYWTKGGLLRNVPVGGGCRKPKRHAAADAHAREGDAHASHAAAKSPRPGGTGTGTAAAPASNAPCAVTTTQPSGAGATAASDGAGAFAADTLPRPVLPPAPAPMFADQAATFALLFAPPPPPTLPAFSFSAPRKAEDDEAPPVPTPTEPQPSSAPPFNSDTAPFAARSGGAAMASSAEAGWPPATSIDAGIFDIAGSDTSYWNPASWTDQDETIYLP